MKLKRKVNLNVLTRNIIILIVVVAVVILVICVPNSGKFSPNVNKSRYRSERNASELKETYDTQENKEKFLEDVSTIQNAVSMSLLNNNVVDESSMKSRIKEINKELKKDNWEMLGIDVITYWVGTWSVDKTGTVKFTFLNNDSIPSWAQDEDVVNHIIVK